MGCWIHGNIRTQHQGVFLYLMTSSLQTRDTII